VYGVLTHPGDNAYADYSILVSINTGIAKEEISDNYCRNIITSLVASDQHLRLTAYVNGRFPALRSTLYVSCRLPVLRFTLYVLHLSGLTSERVRQVIAEALAKLRADPSIRQRLFTALTAYTAHSRYFTKKPVIFHIGRAIVETLYTTVKSIMMSYVRPLELQTGRGVEGAHRLVAHGGLRRGRRVPGQLPQGRAHLLGSCCRVCRPRRRS
jgi:hypothetical protein